MKYSDFSIKSVTKEGKNYPSLLKKIKKPPKQLYYRGELSKKLFKKSLAIVGSRRMTRYGREVVDRFVSSLVSENVTIISGFMYGVDTEAHKKTVEYGGITIAVFGCGLNVIYPPENEKLYTQILKGGGVVFSEYEPAAKPHLWKFPQRNRIVAGLSTLGVLVVEAGEKSGSLITARIALEQGKPVYAIPGPIASLMSGGTNLLIKQALAKMATDPMDILGKKQKRIRDKMPNDLDQLETNIWEALSIEPLNSDELAVAIGEDVIKVGQKLSLMSLRGLIIESSGKYYLAQKG